MKPKLGTRCQSFRIFIFPNASPRRRAGNGEHSITSFLPVKPLRAALVSTNITTLKIGPAGAAPTTNSDINILVQRLLQTITKMIVYSSKGNHRFYFPVNIKLHWEKVIAKLLFSAQC